MRIVRSTTVPILFRGDAVVRDVPVRVVDKLLYGFILGKQFLQDNGSALDFGAGRGLQLVPGAPWVPFRRSVNPVDVLSPVQEFTTLTRDVQLPRLAALPVQPLPSYHDIAWEDDSTLEWTLRLVSDEVSLGGFTSKAVEVAPVGPRPQVGPWHACILQVRQ